MTKEFSPLNTMWTEKYRPKKLSEMVGDFKDKISKQLENPDAMQHLLLYSKTPGTGKTTLAKAIINELGADALILNSSDERKIEVIREKVKGFSNTQSTVKGLRRIVFLDEFDGMLKASQEALRNIMETYAANVLFILTCNNVDKVIAALRSRCLEIAFAYPNKDDIFKYLEMIVAAEDMDYTDEGLKTVVEKNYPSIRNCVKTLQDLNTDGKQVIPENVHTSHPIFEELWIKLVDDKDYKTIKTSIFQSKVDSRELNMYFWNKAWTLGNLKLIQITCKNEADIARGADSNVIVATSLIEMTK